ncbi:MAG: hypothetical protein AAF579_16890 [Cyanobacteria bacterium P01_C01_bin.118]
MPSSKSNTTVGVICDIKELLSEVVKILLESIKSGCLRPELAEAIIDSMIDRSQWLRI